MNGPSGGTGFSSGGAGSPRDWSDGERYSYRVRSMKRGPMVFMVGRYGWKGIKAAAKGRCVLDRVWVPRHQVHTDRS